MAGIEGATGIQWRNGDYHDHVLVDWYLPVMQEALNNVTKWADRISSDSRHVVGGKFITWPTHIGRSTGSNFMDARGNLPVPGKQQYDTHANHVKDYYGRILVDGKTKRQSKTNRASYLGAVDSEMKGIIQDAKIDLQRALLNDGSGRMGVVSGAPAANVVTVAIHGGVSQPATAGNAPTQWMFPGMRLAFMTAVGGSVVHKYILSVDSNTTITVSATEGGAADATGVADADWITRMSDETTEINDTAYRNEILGLEGMFGVDGVVDGNGLANGQTGSYDYTTAEASVDGFQGIATTGNLWNQAILYDNNGTGRNLTDELMQQALSGAERANNANISLFLMPYGVYNNYLQDLYPDKRYGGNNLEAGGTIASFHGIPIFKEKDMYGGRVYGIDESQIRKQEVEAMRWIDEDGSIWNRVPNKDAYEAAFVKSCQMMCYTRERLGFSLLDLNEASLTREAHS